MTGAALTTDNIRISKSLDAAQDHYDVIVVGSGYGASISASRLARAGRKVAILERGREMRPGEFPRTMTEMMNEAQVTVQDTGKVLGQRDAMVDFRLNGDMNVVLGCGLGGTSLINANVSLEIDTRLHDFFKWPKMYRDTPDLLDPYFERARKGLGANPYPDSYPALNKVRALKQSAATLKQEFYHPPINVTFEDGDNHFGFHQNACTNCGDCCTGCNYGAKNTTLMNYLPDARAWGADIITGAEVTHLSKDASWNVHVEGRDTPITAEVVILGAGSLGSTEILLRTAQKTGLEFSDQLGKRFSGNGDVLAFGYNANLTMETTDGDARVALHNTGAGWHDLPLNVVPKAEGAYTPGPVIAGIIDMRRKDRPVTEGLVIEEGILPGPMAQAWSAIFFMTDATAGNMFQFGDTQLRLTDAATIGNMVQTDPTGMEAWSYKGPISRTQTYLVMSHDRSDGTISLDNGTGRAGIVWPGIGRDATYMRDNRILEQAADAIWAEFMPSPVWNDPMGNKLVTVHPIGGCVMADTPEGGVTNAFCQVFDTSGSAATTDTTGQPVHAGLMVCDGAVIPGALGVNPLLTISALTEHAVEALAKREGWSMDLTTNKPLPADCTVPSGSTPAAPAGPDMAQILDMVVAALTAINTEIHNGDLKTALASFLAAYKLMYDQIGGETITYMPSPDHMADVMSESLMKNDIGPVFDEFLPPLTKIRDAFNAGDSGAALAVLRETMGDFSPGLSFFEKMHGYVSTEGLDRPHPVSDPYELAARNGKENGEAIVGYFHIQTDSLEKMMADKTHTAKLAGKVEWTKADGKTASYEVQDDATFQLFAPQDDQVDCWYMIYDGTISNEGFLGLTGEKYHFHGFKTLKKRAGSSWWGDTTTLSVDLRDKKDGPVIARGIMTLGIEDLATQLSTVTSDVTGMTTSEEISLGGSIAWTFIKGSGLAEVLADKETRAEIIKELMLAAASHGHPGFAGAIKEYYLAQFGGLFAKLIFQVYGGVLSYLQNFPELADKARIAADKANPPKRPLPAPTPDLYYPEPEPGVKLALTRYKGGAKGPVILAPGFGVTASSYAMTTTPVNFTEYLCNEGYDVWLFDYRGSPALKATQQPFTIDDIALKDWPAAIKMVNDETGQDVQIIAHCVASMSLLMGMLRGQSGIKSVISSQTTLHPVTSWVNYAKADSGLASILKDGAPKSMDGLIEKLGLPEDMVKLLENGMPTVNMSPDYPGPTQQYPDPSQNPAYIREKAIDLLLFSIPFPDEEPCSNPVCHRVFGVFGASYVHDQLNEATHNALRDVFGEVSSTPFIQLSNIMTAGIVVDAQGRNTYMGGAKNIRVPVDFIAGSRNQIFYPETSLRTYNWLLANHPETGGEQFSRKTFADYAHMDMFIGKNATAEVFPYLLDRLENRAK